MKNKCFRPQLVIPRQWEECFTYAQQVDYLYSKITSLEEKVAELEKKVVDKSSEV